MTQRPKTPWLSDCVSKDSGTAELLIVRPGPLRETAVETRDRMTQAILTLGEDLATPRAQSMKRWITVIS